MQIVEWIGVISGIAAVFLLYKNHILTWPVGFINIGCFLWMFWQQRLYGDFVVQLIFLTTGIWGWANWKLKVQKLPGMLLIKEQVLWILFTLLTIPFFTWYFSSYTDCSYPLAEATILSLSITGQCLTALRKLENWYYWLLADFLMIIIYYKKELYPTSVYAAVIFIIGIFGLVSWRKMILKAKAR